MDNGFEDVRIEEVEIKLKVRQSVDLANIASIDVDKKRLYAGESLRLNVWVSPFEGKKVSLGYEVGIPKTCDPGPAELMVLGADSYLMWEQMRAKGKFEPTSLGDVIDMLTEAPSHRQLLVVLARKEQVTMLGRKTLPQLPASAEAVLSSAAYEGTRAKTRFEVLQRLVFNTDYNLAGKQSLNIEIRPREY